MLKNFIFGLILVLVVGMNLWLGFSLPALLPLIAPLAYLLVIVVILLWIHSVGQGAGSPPPRQAAGQVPASSLSPERPLKATEILGWEFEYARVTASEAMSDRQAMVNFYLAIAGAIPTVVAILIIDGPELANLTAYHTAGTVAFWVLVAIGWVFFLKIVQLRWAWHNSLLAMNCIKDFYLEHTEEFDREELGQAFRWKTATLPRRDKKWNIFFYSAMLIALLNSISFTLGSFLLDLHVLDAGQSGWFADLHWATWIGLGLAMFLLHFIMYSLFLKESPKKPKKEAPSVKDDWKLPPRPNRRVEVLETVRDYDGFYKIDRVRYRFERFDGAMSVPVTRLVFERGDSVCVLPYDPAKDAVLLIQQFRYPAYVRNGPGWLWEIIAGIQDRGRDRIAVAHAELMEEAGYGVDDLVPITQFYLSPGGSSERIFFYLAYVSPANHVHAGGGLAEENEDISVSVVPFREAMNMIDSGTIIDAKTIVALQWLALHKNDLPHLSRERGKG